MSLSTNGTFSRTDEILDHKTNFHKFKKIGILSNTFSDLNGKKLVIYIRRNARELINMLN